MTTARTASAIVRMAVRDLTDDQIRAYLDELRRPGRWTEDEFAAVKADLDAAWSTPDGKVVEEVQVTADDVQRLARSGETEPGSVLVDDGDAIRVVCADQTVSTRDRLRDGGLVLLTYQDICDSTGDGDWAPNGLLDRHVARGFAEEANSIVRS